MFISERLDKYNNSNTNFKIRVKLYNLKRATNNRKTLIYIYKNEKIVFNCVKKHKDSESKVLFKKTIILCGLYSIAGRLPYLD